jgi:nucleoside-diphosphate-sugar epimerase
MKILITGTNGYIGKSLTEKLKEKYEVVALTRQLVDLTNCKDVHNFFKDKYFDVVIHCAVVGGSRLKADTWNDLDTNLIMYYNLLQCRSHFNKFIHLGSGAEIFLKETPYGLSKHTIRKSVLEKNNFYNIRIFGVFDENELDTRFIKANITRYINKQSIIIHQNNFMDFIYMPDFIKIVDHYINNNGPKEIDCTYKKTYNMSGIANIINNLTNNKVEIKILSSKIENYSGQQCTLPINFIGLEEGIKNIFIYLNQ